MWPCCQPALPSVLCVKHREHCWHVNKAKRIVIRSIYTPAQNNEPLFHRRATNFKMSYRNRTLEIAQYSYMYISGDDKQGSYSKLTQV